MGRVWVPAERYWGAETQRALEHFSIGEERTPKEIIRALANIKIAAAKANAESGRLEQEKSDLIQRAAEEVLAGQLDDSFPLPVWVSGSGTQVNMNVNEVIANRAIELAGGRMGSKAPVHPNDHVNMSQSTNDVFPTAIHIAVSEAVRKRLLPETKMLRDSLDQKAHAWMGIVKTGRTHMMDALPVTLGQEFSGYAAMLDDDRRRIKWALDALFRLPLGGTAVGTGTGAPKGFGGRAIELLAGATALPLVPAENRFAFQGSHDALVAMSGAVKILAVSLYKIASDIRLMASGPRCGLQELILPKNEPGSSMMPGKVNPTQCEAMTMAAIQVIGYDTAVSFAGAGGALEMNAYKPLMAFDVIQSVRLMADSCFSFRRFLVEDIAPNDKQIEEYVDRSLMLVTALVPGIGHERASHIARLAHDEGLTLKEAALTLGEISAEDFERLVDPRKMAMIDG
jgi:fumarate hydratase class II